MVRRKPRPSTEGELRAFLLAEAIALRDLYGGVSPDCWIELSKPVDRLAAGQAHWLRRFELPDDHPARSAGHPGDYLVLGADDVLRADVAECVLLGVV